eukprot:3591063-Pleurochrysis_carterae.AAC.1
MAAFPYSTLAPSEIPTSAMDVCSSRASRGSSAAGKHPTCFNCSSSCPISSFESYTSAGNLSTTTPARRAPLASSAALTLAALALTGSPSDSTTSLLAAHSRSACKT